MRRLLATIAALAMALTGSALAPPSAQALDGGTFTVAGWSSGNLTIDTLAISRDTAGIYSVTSLVFTVGGKQATVTPFGDRGCTPNGAECKIINANHVEARDNFVGYSFIADLSGMDGPAPTLTMYDAKYSPQFWDGFGGSPSTGLTPVLVPSTPAPAAITPSTATEAGAGTAEISGANLIGTNSVAIGGKGAAIVAVTADKVVVTIPPMPAAATVGTALDVVVTAPAGSGTLASAFTYTSNPPSVSGVTPSCGVTAGTTLTIAGYRFAGTTSVTIGGQPVPFTVSNANPGSSRITTTAPALAGSQPVTVTTPAGSSSGLSSISYLRCASLPPLTLDVTSTTPAGGFATIRWSFPAGHPDLGNVLGLQYGLTAGGPYANVGGIRSGTSGSFTVSGLTKTPVLVWVKVVNADPQGKPAYGQAGVSFASTPTPLPPSTGNAGSVPPPVATAGPDDPSAGSAGGGPTTADAPCLAAKGDLYPSAFGTVGSQLVVAPGRPGDPTLTRVTVTSGALPPGLGLDTRTGIVYGVPTAAGRYSAGLVGAYPDGSRASGLLAITIDNNSQTLTYPALVVGGVGQTVTTGPTTNAPVGSTYDIVCGRLPDGVSFDRRTGVMAGTTTKLDLRNPPIRIVERNLLGSAAASFVFLVSPRGLVRLSYPAHPYLRVAKRARIRPGVVAAGDLLYFTVIRGKLTRGLRLNPTTGVIGGRPRTRSARPHTITVAGVHADGTLVPSNPMTITVRRPGQAGSTGRRAGQARA